MKVSFRDLFVGLLLLLSGEIEEVEDDNYASDSCHHFLSLYFVFSTGEWLGELTPLAARGSLSPLSAGQAPGKLPPAPSYFLPSGSTLVRM